MTVKRNRESVGTDPVSYWPGGALLILIRTAISSISEYRHQNTDKKYNE